MYYNKSDLVNIAKRENNNKRGYLVVNPLQGKHVPASPTDSFSLFHQLSNLIADKYDKESTLIIGFAETATAIGACVAADLDMHYVQTTRECIEYVDYIFFEESHSHATEQKLVRNGIERLIMKGKIKRIVFVEDEVTTGNTILSLIEAMNKQWSSKLQYSVASLLNGMDEEALNRFQDKGIGVHYLVKTEHSDYEDVAESFRGDGHCYCMDRSPCSVECINIHDGINTRRITTGSKYQEACEKLWSRVKDKVMPDRSTLLGTEEFMYPAMYVAKKIEDSTEATVRYHATTRSPIVVSTEKEYPLHQRWNLVSLYDENRKTFIYDLDRYDQVLILTDAVSVTADGISSLVNALASRGNKNIILFKWYE